MYVTCPEVSGKQANSWFRDVFAVSFIAIKLYLLIQILMSSSLIPPQSPISSAPIRLPLLWSVGIPEEKSKDITEQNIFVLRSLLRPLLQGFRSRSSSHLMSMQVSKTLGWICRELISSDLAGALSLPFIKICNTWDKSSVPKKISKSALFPEKRREGGW